jgi:hypothetical protein
MMEDWLWESHAMDRQLGEVNQVGLLYLEGVFSSVKRVGDDARYNRKNDHDHVAWFAGVVSWVLVNVLTIKGILISRHLWIITCATTAYCEAFQPSSSEAFVFSLIPGKVAFGNRKVRF